MTLQATRQEVGIVVNASLDKTITVLVQRKVKHPLYKKILKRSTKILVHDDENECSKGDEVTIQECIPISKNKSWKFIKIIKRTENKEK